MNEISTYVSQTLFHSCNCNTVLADFMLDYFPHLNLEREQFLQEPNRNKVQ